MEQLLSYAVYFRFHGCWMHQEEVSYSHREIGAISIRQARQFVMAAMTAHYGWAEFVFASGGLMDSVGQCEELREGEV